MNSNKRQKLSGAAYRKQKKQRDAEIKLSAGTMSQFLIHSEVVPLTPAPDLEPSITSTFDETVLSQINRRDTSEDGGSESEFDSESNPTIESYSEIDCVQQSADIEPELFTDAGVWNIPLSDAIRVEIVLRRPYSLQNKNGPFKSRKVWCKPKGRSENSQQGLVLRQA